jgi:uncharacterized spore protein YtfJ
LSTNLNESLEVLFSKMENFIASKTVIGDAIHVDDIIIVPLIDISLGVGASAANNSSKKENSIGGLGAKITPSSVLVIQNNTVQLVNIKNQDSMSKLIDIVPGLLTKLTSLKKKNNHNK